MGEAYEVADLVVETIAQIMKLAGLTVSQVPSPPHITYLILRRWRGAALLICTRKEGRGRILLSQPACKYPWYCPLNGIVRISARSVLRRCGARLIPLADFRKTLRSDKKTRRRSLPMETPPVGRAA